ncbi:MAG: response regulator transcription factor [Chitinophagales bacterium]|nr:response regulator transcription factor [Chitinophagales bacterium]
MRCLIVDDEPLARDVIENYIGKVSELTLIGSCNNAVEAFEYLHKDQIDLIFLDIQMPEITGVDFLKSLNNPPAVIFTTAYSEYAVEGFNLNVADYLLKPVPFDRFLKAVNKVIENAMEKNLNGDSSSSSTPDEYMFIKTDKKIVKIKYNDIMYIEGLKDYVMIYTKSERHITLMTMKGLEAKLPSNMFKRVHKSYIISIDKIKSILGNLIEIGEKHVPIGKMYKEEFFKIVEKHNLIK